MATSFDCFFAAEQVEDLASRIYRFVARQLAAQPEAERLFSRLADEEVQHGLRVRMLRTQYATDARRLKNVVLDYAAIEGARREGEMLLHLLTSSREPLTFAEARRLAIELEETFALVHAQQMAQCADPDLKAFFEALARQDREHVALLRETQITGC
jgi:rubrerythrin